jgi:pyruvate dehydrogenase E2 component (dihydrolipoamide acetyltransferase)
MPKLGLTMNSGVVSQWKKKEGDSVRKGEILMVVATDKLTFDVECPQEGVLVKVLIPEGKDVPVGEILAYIGASGESVAEAPLPAEAKTAVPEESGAPEESPVKGTLPSGLRATPLARKTARELGVDIGLVPGSGPSGRIVRKDVDTFAASAPSSTVKASPVAARMAADLGVGIDSIAGKDRVMKEDVLRAASASSKVVPADADVRIPLTPMRRIIAERMSLSNSTIPSVTFNVETDFSALMAFRNRVKDEGAKKGVKISYNHILMKICAAALKEIPLANASFDGDAIVLHGNVNIGLAVSVEGGLLVPNVKSVQSKSLMRIAEETDLLVEQARSGSLALEAMQGGTFTITNLGMFGIQSFTPIVNPPEACILGVNTIVEKAVVINGEIAIRPVSVLTLVADHRILDGAEAARFLARIREIVENPWILLL